MANIKVGDVLYARNRIEDVTTMSEGGQGQPSRVITPDMPLVVFELYDTLAFLALPEPHSGLHVIMATELLTNMPGVGAIVHVKQTGIEVPMYNANWQETSETCDFLFTTVGLQVFATEDNLVWVLSPEGERFKISLTDLAPGLVKRPPKRK